MSLPPITAQLNLIGLNDKIGHVAASVVCDWTLNSTVNVSLNSASFQGSELKNRLDRVLVDNTQNKGIVTVSFLGLTVSVSPFQRQNVTLPDKVDNVIFSGTVGQTPLIFMNQGELAQDTLNNFLSSINAGTTGLFAVNKYVASTILSGVDLNKTIVISNGAVSVLTFPPISSTPVANGIIMLVENIGTASCTLTPNILDNFNGGASGASISLAGGDTIMVVSDGGSTWFAKYISKSGSGGIPHTSYVTAVGAGTFTTNVNHKAAMITVIGGGGGGQNNGINSSGSGGGGGLSRKTYNLTPNTAYNLVVGGGGGANANGGSSSFTDGVTPIQATGGAGGNIFIQNAIGGIGSGGDLNLQGSFGYNNNLTGVDGRGGSPPLGYGFGASNQTPVQGSLGYGAGGTWSPSSGSQGLIEIVEYY